MPERRELGADLAPPPRHEDELEQGRGPSALQHAVAGDRLPAAASLARGPNTQSAVLDEVPGQGTRRRADDTLDAGDVDTLRQPRAELRLQGLLDGERLGEDEQAGGGPLALGFGRDRQEPRGLLDDHEVLVLMNEPERRREAGGRR